MEDSEQLKSLIEQRNTLDKQIRELQQKLYAEASPFKIGQEITWKHGKGRRHGVVMHFSGFDSLVARIRLKDGRNGGTKRVCYPWDKPESLEVSHG